MAVFTLGTEIVREMELPLFWDAPHFSVNDNRNTQDKEVFFGNLGLKLRN